MLPVWVVVIASMLAPFGYARTLAFIINRTIFGHRDDKPLLKWAAIGGLLTLLALTLLFVPMIAQFYDRDPSRFARGGTIWLLTSAAIGIGWFIERVERLLHKQRIDEVELVASRVIRLRRAHIPYPSLQKLGLHNDVYDPEINLWRVRIPNLPSSFVGYRIAFLSDTHVAPFMRRALYRTMIEQISATLADLVILGGDYVTWGKHVPLIHDAILEGLNPPDGCYAVLGNHDYWADRDGIITTMTLAGVKMLHNRSIQVRRGEESIHVVGIDEVYRGKPDIAEALAGIAPDALRIAVSHHPDIVDYFKDERIDLLMCGHTHGGQICLPFLGPLIVPSMHEVRYAAGFFRVRNLLMYVGRGVGGVPPVRILCRPELPIFELTNE